ncbi:MAG: VWA domain-containing protein [Desulfobacterales bacterium]|nr:VWA domain-containing protein [Desulfobacterales bacterium]
MKKYLVVLYVGIVAVLTVSSAFCQSLKINTVNADLYPHIHAYATVIKDGEVVCYMSRSDFKLYENDIPMDLTVIPGRATDTSLLLLMDESGSMSSVMENVRAAAVNFVEVLGDKDRAAAYSFGSYDHVLIPMRDVATQTDKNSFRQAMKKYGTHGDGGTNLFSAIQAVNQKELAKKKEKGRRKAIVALTDGASAGSLDAAINVCEINRVAVYTIAMGSFDSSTLNVLSESTGGNSYQLSDNPTPEQLNEVYQDIKNRLDCQYTLIYDSPVNCHDGTSVPVKVSIPGLAVLPTAEYKRPYNLNQMNINLSFADIASGVQAEPPEPVECEKVNFYAEIKARSCSSAIDLKNVFVSAYDIIPGYRKKVASSEPATLRLNGDSATAVAEWDTRNYRGDRTLEFVIHSGDQIAETSEKDNFLQQKIKVSQMVHDLYFKSIDYEPKPAAPCDMVRIKVRVDDATLCKGLELGNIEVEVKDGNKLLGRTETTVRTGDPEELVFEWDAKGFMGFRVMTFLVDPDRRFKDEQNLKNNRNQIKIEVSPIKHDLFPTTVSHKPKHPIVGDIVAFEVEVNDSGHCPDVPLGQQILLRVKDAKTNRGLAYSDPFTTTSGKSTVVTVQWETKLNDHGSRSLLLEADPEQKVSEPDPPGRENNTTGYQVEIQEMPHDLLIESVSVSPETPKDGDPAMLKAVIYDEARFPDVKLENVAVKAFDRYTGALLGISENMTIYSQNKTDIELPIDTGGYAGKRDILVEVDPDKKINELTKEGLDGENNNSFIKSVSITE